MRFAVRAAVAVAIVVPAFVLGWLHGGLNTFAIAFVAFGLAEVLARLLGRSRAGQIAAILAGAAVTAGFAGWGLTHPRPRVTAPQPELYLDVDEVDARLPVGATGRVRGHVVEGSIAREVIDQATHTRFQLTAKGHTLAVEIVGPLPDTFRDGAEVVADGKLIAPGRFEAREVLAKCPDRYRGR